MKVLSFLFRQHPVWHEELISQMEVYEVVDLNHKQTTEEIDLEKRMYEACTSILGCRSNAGVPEMIERWREAFQKLAETDRRRALISAAVTIPFVAGRYQEYASTMSGTWIDVFKKGDWESPDEARGVYVIAVCHFRKWLDKKDLVAFDALEKTLPARSDLVKGTPTNNYKPAQG